MAYGPQLLSEWRWRKVSRAFYYSQLETKRQMQELIEEMDHARKIGRDEVIDQVSTIRILDGVLDPPIPARQSDWKPEEDEYLLTPEQAREVLESLNDREEGLVQPWHPSYGPMTEWATDGDGRAWRPNA